MRKRIQIISLVLLFISTTLLSIKIAIYLSETYFFDKIFYQKSSEFGYLPRYPEKMSWNDFGVRGADIKPFLMNQESSNKVLGTNTDNEYKIALIGDSIVWGTGLKEDETLASLLSKKLGGIRKTKVLQLGFPGDSLIDNYIKYLKVKENVGANLYIFITVDNDLLFNRLPRYDDTLYYRLIHMCDDVLGDLIYNTSGPLDAPGYMKLLDDSLKNPKNNCILDRMIPLYPKNDAIYFQTTYESPDKVPDFYLYPTVIKDNGLTLLSAYMGKNIDRYKKYFEQNNLKAFNVSEKELHPSALANQMYVDIITNEIINNPSWGFK